MRRAPSGRVCGGHGRQSHLDRTATAGFNPGVRIYGDGSENPPAFWALVDLTTQSVIDFYPSRPAAERELAEVLTDEPDWCHTLDVRLIPFGIPDAAG